MSTKTVPRSCPKACRALTKRVSNGMHQPTKTQKPMIIHPMALAHGLGIVNIIIPVKGKVEPTPRSCYLPVGRHKENSEETKG